MVGNGDSQINHDLLIGVIMERDRGRTERGGGADTDCQYEKVTVYCTYSFCFGCRQLSIFTIIGQRQRQKQRPKICLHCFLRVRDFVTHGLFTHYYLLALPAAHIVPPVRRSSSSCAAGLKFFLGTFVPNTTSPSGKHS